MLSRRSFLQASAGKLAASAFSAEPQKPLVGSQLYGWGQYYPRIAFSPDASRLVVCADSVVVFDTGSWRWYKMQGDANICAWHPREPWLLGLEPTTGKLRWSDLQDMDNPRTWSAHDSPAQTRD